MKNISLLGSTGSIGRNVLRIIQQFPDKFRIVGLAAGRNIGLLQEQIATFHPQLVSVADETIADELLQLLPTEWNSKVVCGRTGNEQVASLDTANVVVSAIVGAEGLVPTLAAIRAGKNIALANKETLVIAGQLIMDEVRRNNVQMLPIDSEHSAIFQSLEAGRRQDVAKIILTASGGPFWKMSQDELDRVTPEQALAHPNWDMGRKISIDSATLMNKGLEVIEAKWLFDIDLEKIEVLVHTQSIVHSLVEFVDGSVIAQMGIPDMRIPIGYALSYPERLCTGLSRLDLAQCKDLTFMQPDHSRFPSLSLAYDVCKQGGTKPAILNAANEIAVEAFLKGQIPFPGIAEIVSKTLAQEAGEEASTIAQVMEADLKARQTAGTFVAADT